MAKIATRALWGMLAIVFAAMMSIAWASQEAVPKAEAKSLTSAKVSAPAKVRIAGTERDSNEITVKVKSAARATGYEYQLLAAWSAEDR